jgi:hypothetical protein
MGLGLSPRSESPGEPKTATSLRIVANPLDDVLMSVISLTATQECMSAYE